jgi:uncharacterized protein
MTLVNAIAGFGVGAAVGMTGVGGGSLMTPILVLLFGYTPATAVGTDLWFAAATKIVGGALHHRRGTVDWQILRRLSIGSIPATIITLVWMYRTGAAQYRAGLIVHVLGGVLLVTSVAMLAQKTLRDFARRQRTTTPESFKMLQPTLTALAGVILGVCVSLTSVGAGALGTAMLMYLYPLRMNPARQVGTDIVHAIPLAIIAGTGHLLMGNVDTRLLLNLLIGSIPGVLIGSFAASKSPDGFLRVAIAVVLLFVSIKLVLA